MKTKTNDYQTSLIKDTHHDQKNSAFLAVRGTFNASVKAPTINNDSDAPHAIRLSYERTKETKNTTNGIGSSSGSWRIIRSGNSRIYPVTAPPSSNASKTIGSSRLRQNWRTSVRSNIWFLTALTSTRTAA